MGAHANKDKITFVKILKLMGFVEDRVGKHREVWKHIPKNLIIQLPGSPSGMRWGKN